MDKVPRQHIRIPGVPQDDFEVCHFLFGHRVDKMKKKVHHAIRGGHKTNRLLSSVDVSLKPRDVVGMTHLDPGSSNFHQFQEEGRFERDRAFLTEAGDTSSTSLSHLSITNPPAPDEDATKRAIRRVREARQRRLMIEDAEENGGPGYIQESFQDTGGAPLSARDHQNSRYGGCGSGQGVYSVGLSQAKLMTDRTAPSGGVGSGAVVVRRPRSTGDLDQGKAANPGGDDGGMLSGSAAQVRRAAIIEAARAAVQASHFVEGSAAARQVGVNFRHFKLKGMVLPQEQLMKLQDRRLGNSLSTTSEAVSTRVPSTSEAASTIAPSASEAASTSVPSFVTDSRFEAQETRQGRGSLVSSDC